MSEDGIVLVVSVGQTDLQLAVRDERGQLLRCSIKSVRAFHQDLLDGALAYRFAPELAALPEAPMGVGLEWNAEGGYFEADAPYEAVVEDESGAVPLIPAKLKTIVSSLAALGKVTGAIVLSTHRDSPKRGRNVFDREPIAAGPLIARWMAVELDLTYGGEEGRIGPGKAGWVNFLDGAMELTGGGRDYPVNRQAVDRIDAALAQAAHWPGVSTACLSLGGGLPPLKAPILAAAAFRFDRVLDVRIPQFGQPPQWSLAHHPQPTPVESFQTRSLVRDALRRGDFQGANALARRVSGDPQESAWAKPLTAAARYFAGSLDSTTDMPEYIQALKAERLPESLGVAMRVEAALASGRIQEAIMLTFTFADTALLDGIKQLFPCDCRFLPLMKQVRCQSQRLPPQVEALKSPCERDYKQRPTLSPVERYPGTYYFNLEGPHMDRWMDEFPSDLSKAIYAFEEATKEKCQVTGLEDTWFVIPRFIRNALAHNTLSAAEIEAAKQAFQQIGHWASDQERGLGMRFLNQSPARKILNALGVERPRDYYTNLVEGLTKDLEARQPA